MPLTTTTDKTGIFSRLAAITAEPPARTIRRTPEGYLYCTVRLRDQLPAAAKPLPPH